MAEDPWIRIVGLSEDGPDGLSGASLRALKDADVIFGAARHLERLGPVPQETVTWPVPFSEGLDMLRDHRGRQVAALVSGDPFWFGAGSVIARHFSPEEWSAFPAPSTFSLAAGRMGWPLEKTVCTGLHAAPLTRLRPYLARGVRLIVLVRDGLAVPELARYLVDAGFDSSALVVFEALGGPREVRTAFAAHTLPHQPFAHPVCIAIEVAGDGAAIPAVSGIEDAFFDTDGVMTKRCVRAVTMSALAPRPGDRLWDIGGGSGSIAIEWLLAHPSCAAISIEPRADRVGLIRTNAARLGVDRLNVVTGSAPEALTGLEKPDAVFIGGGLSQEMLSVLQERLGTGTRIVANAVTLEAEQLLSEIYAKRGGEMVRLDVSMAKPLGGKHAWERAYPVVQWSGVL